MAQHGRRSPRIFLVGTGAPPGSDGSVAAVPDVTLIADRPARVNDTDVAVSQVRSNRDLGDCAAGPFGARHAVAAWTARPVVRQFRGRAFAGPVGADSGPIIATSATSTFDSGTAQYREIEQTSIGGVWLPRNDRGFLGTVSGIGVVMPLRHAVGYGARPAAELRPGADSATARPTTGVDAA